MASSQRVEDEIHILIFVDEYSPVLWRLLAEAGRYKRLAALLYRFATWTNQTDGPFCKATKHLISINPKTNCTQGIVAVNVDHMKAAEISKMSNWIQNKNVSLCGEIPIVYDGSCCLWAVASSKVKRLDLSIFDIVIQLNSASEFEEQQLASFILETEQMEIMPPAHEIIDVRRL